MDLDDIFGESRYESRKKSHKNEHINQQVLKDLVPLSSKERIFVEQLELEQALISKKIEFNAYSVEREYVNSKEYHDKFEILVT